MAAPRSLFAVVLLLVLLGPTAVAPTEVAPALQTLFVQGWREVARLPPGAAAGGAAAALRADAGGDGGVALVASGTTQGAPDDAGAPWVWRNGTWAQPWPGAAWPAARRGAVMAPAFASAALLFGGVAAPNDNPGVEALRDVWLLRNARWTRGRDLPAQPRAYAAGGWLPPASPAAPDARLSGALGYLVVHGGTVCDDGAGECGKQQRADWSRDLDVRRRADETFIYDVSADAWAPLAPGERPAARAGHACATVELPSPDQGESDVSALMCFGGQDDRGVFLSDAWVLLLGHADGDAQDAHAVAGRAFWVEATQRDAFGAEKTYERHAHTTPAARRRHALAARGDRVYLHGGELATRVTRDSYSCVGRLWVGHLERCGYTTSQRNERKPRLVLTWDKVVAGNEPAPLAGHSLALLGTGRMLILGGFQQKRLSPAIKSIAPYAETTPNDVVLSTDLVKACDAAMANVSCSWGIDQDAFFSACGQPRSPFLRKTIRLETQVNEEAESVVPQISITDALREHLVQFNSSVTSTVADGGIIRRKYEVLVEAIPKSFGDELRSITAMVGGMRVSDVLFIRTWVFNNDEQGTYILETFSLRNIPISVTNVTNGSPLEGIAVTILYPDGSLAARKTTDGAGMVLAKLLPAGDGSKYEIRVGDNLAAPMMIRKFSPNEPMPIRLFVQSGGSGGGAAPSPLAPPQSPPPGPGSGLEGGRLSIVLHSPWGMEWGGERAPPSATWEKLLLTATNVADPSDEVILHAPKAMTPRGTSEIARSVILQWDAEWTYPREPASAMLQSKVVIDLDALESMLRDDETYRLAVARASDPFIVLNSTEFSVGQVEVRPSLLTIRCAAVPLRTTLACSAHGFENKDSHYWGGTLDNVLYWSEDPAYAAGIAKPCCIERSETSHCQLIRATDIGAVLDALDLASGNRTSLEAKATDRSGIATFEVFASVSHELDVRFGTMLYGRDGEQVYQSLRQPLRIAYNDIFGDLDDFTFVRKKSLTDSAVQLNRQMLCTGSTLMYGRKGAWRNLDADPRDGTPPESMPMYTVGTQCDIIVIPYAGIEYAVTLKLNRAGVAPGDEIIIEREGNSANFDEDKWVKAESFTGPSKETDSLKISTTAVRLRFKDNQIPQPSPLSYMNASLLRDNAITGIPAEVGEGFSFRWDAKPDTVSALSYLFFASVMASSAISVMFVFFAHRIMRRTWMERMTRRFQEPEPERVNGFRPSLAMFAPGAMQDVALAAEARPTPNTPNAEEIRSVVHALPQHKYIVPLEGSENDATMCSVCLEDFEQGDSIVVLPCMHKYHGTCVNKWLLRDPACPICRRSLFDSGLPPSGASAAARPPSDPEAGGVPGGVSESTRLLPNDGAGGAASSLARVVP